GSVHACGSTTLRTPRAYWPGLITIGVIGLKRHATPVPVVTSVESAMVMAPEQLEGKPADVRSISQNIREALLRTRPPAPPYPIRSEATNGHTSARCGVGPECGICIDHPT